MYLSIKNAKLHIFSTKMYHFNLLTMKNDKILSYKYKCRKM